MSRSYKKYPHIGFSPSEKFDKRQVHKKLRHKCKEILHRHGDTENITESHFPTRDDIKDHWDYAKDGGYDEDPKTDDYHYYLDGKLRK